MNGSFLSHVSLHGCSESSDAARLEAFELLVANKPAGCFITTFKALLASGDSSAAEMVVPGKNGWSEDPIMNLLYTSGSSGRPKGAVYREHILHGTMMVCLPAHKSLKDSSACSPINGWDIVGLFK